MRLNKRFGSRLPAAAKLSVWEKLNGQKLGSLPPHPSPKNMSFQIALVSHSSPFSILCLCRPAPGVVGFLHTVYTHPCALPLGNGAPCAEFHTLKGRRNGLLQFRFYEKATIFDKISRLADIPLDLTFTYLVNLILTFDIYLLTR